MKRAFLHIGLSKTGTTAIQVSLSKSRSKLLANGLFYPGNETDHALLLPTFHQLGPDHYRYKNAGVAPAEALRQSQAFLKQFEQKLRRYSGDVLMSSEYLQNMNTAAWSKLCHYLENLGFEVHILCYLRHPVSHATSSIQQDVKMGNTRLDELLEEPRWPRARQHLVHVMKVLPKERIHLRRFEDARADGIEIDILRQIGYGGPLDEIERVNVNTSLSMTGILLADARTRINAEGGNADAVNNFLFKIGGPKFALPPRTVKKVLIKAKDDLEWLNKHFGISYDDIELPAQKRRSLTPEAATDIVNIILSLSKKKLL